MTTKTKKSEPLPIASRSATTPAAGGVTRTTMVVTPALAAEWLKSNSRNRKLDMTAVERLATAIRGGGWVSTHQGIAFGDDGVLYDGQHRLHAIVAAGIPVTIDVTRGLPRAALDVIDIGGKGQRVAAHVLQITDDLHLSSNHVAILSAAQSLIETNNVAGWGKQTPQRLRAAHADHGAGMFVIAEALGVGDHAKIGPAPVAGSLVVAWRTEPASAVAFAQALRSGENLSAGSPTLALRNFLIERRVSRGCGIDRNDISLRTFGAFDAYVRGTSLKMLKPSAGARDRYVAAWKRAAEG